MRAPLRLGLLLGLLLSTVTSAALGAASAATPAAEKRVVRGTDGYLFIAQDWSVPCQNRGQASQTADRMEAFVDAVRRSGRDARIVLGPDKATLRTGNVPRTVPQKACGAAERSAVWSTLTQRLGPDFLDLRRPLAAAGARWQTYYRQDTHWTPTGGAVYGKAIAGAFDPEVARRLTSATTTWSRRGDLANVLGIPGVEKVPGYRAVNPGVQVSELERGDAGTGMGSRHFLATPTVDTGRVVPGRTLFLGDSMDGTVAPEVAPGFRDSTFLWPDGDTDADVLADRIADFDRVVVMRVERFSAQWRPYDQDVLDALQRLPRRPGLLVPSFR